MKLFALGFLFCSTLVSSVFAEYRVVYSGPQGRNMPVKILDTETNSTIDANIQYSYAAINFGVPQIQVYEQILFKLGFTAEQDYALINRTDNQCMNPHFFLYDKVRKKTFDVLLAGNSCTHVQYHNGANPYLIAKYVSEITGLADDEYRYALVSQTEGCWNPSFVLYDKVEDKPVHITLNGNTCTSINYYDGKNPKLVALQVAQLQGLDTSLPYEFNLEGTDRLVKLVERFQSVFAYNTTDGDQVNLVARIVNQMNILSDWANKLDRLANADQRHGDRRGGRGRWRGNRNGHGDRDEQLLERARAIYAQLNSVFQSVALDLWLVKDLTPQAREMFHKIALLQNRIGQQL